MSNRRRSAVTPDKRKNIFCTLTDNDEEAIRLLNCSLARSSLESILPETHFTRDELRAIYRAFKNELPLYRDSFRDIYASIFPHGDVEHFADLVFDSLGNERAGCIAFPEFIKAYSILSRGTMEEKLNWMYKLYDPKNTGKIEWERIFRIITAADDLMGPRAVPPMSQAQRVTHANQIVQKFDRQNKGWISREEFMTVCKEDENILRSISALCPMNTVII